MDELAPRAEIFRSKLIEDFQLIDRVANSSGAEPPKYYSNEITGTVFSRYSVKSFRYAVQQPIISGQIFRGNSSPLNISGYDVGKAWKATSLLKFFSHVSRLHIQFLRSQTFLNRFPVNFVSDDEVMKQLLRETPQGLIKFQIYSKKDEQRFVDRRLNRVKNKNAIPLGPWAHTVIEGLFNE